MQAAASAKPADRNPMGLSADALDASAWKSESRTAAERASGPALFREKSVCDTRRETCSSAFKACFNSTTTDEAAARREIVSPISKDVFRDERRPKKNAMKKENDPLAGNKAGMTSNEIAETRTLINFAWPKPSIMGK
jgi:hypothetical protein